MASAAHWDAHASVYERVWEQSTLLWGQDALALAVEQTPRRGRLLDVACGSGALAIHAATLGYDVTAMDSSSAMVALLRQKLLATPQVHVATHVGDGQTLDGLQDASFDVVTSNFGIFLFPDRAAAWRSVWRVLAPGGCVVATSWDNSNFNVRLIAYLMEHAEDTPLAKEYGGLLVGVRPAVNRMMAADSFTDELVESGFHDVRVDTISHVMHFPSGRELVTGVLDNKSFLALVGHKEPASLRRCILEFVQRELDGDESTRGKDGDLNTKSVEDHPLWNSPVTLLAVAHVAIATKPHA